MGYIYFETSSIIRDKAMNEKIYSIRNSGKKKVKIKIKSLSRNLKTIFFLIVGRKGKVIRIFL